MVGFNEDQMQFEETVGRFLADKSPTSEVRKQMASTQGFDREVWQQLSGELGLIGTHIPEAYGGFGFGPVELGIINEQMGRYLYCGPFFASAVMAGYALLNCGSEAQKERLLPGIVSGQQIASLVLDDVNRWQGIGQSISANAQQHLSGNAPIVLDAHNAHLLIVAARHRDSVGLFVVEPNQTGVEINLLESLDPTRKVCSVNLHDVPGEVLGNGTCNLAELWDLMSCALAHEMLGGAQALFDSTLEYMQMRVQFGRTIGSFQALKHRCADLLLELELARAATHEAARYLASKQGDPYAVNMAKALTSDAYVSIAKQAIQLRGGIGFTWEEDTHLWFKRAKSSEVFLGTPNWHREEMMQKMLASNSAEVAHG